MPVFRASVLLIYTSLIEKGNKRKIGKEGFMGFIWLS
jgi:hypothetical protein